jgi:sortase B
MNKLHFNYLIVILILLIIGINSLKSNLITKTSNNYEYPIDFNSLLNINQDVIGYLIVPGTNINYPVVQTSDNNYYLSHNLKREDSKMGWIFMDYRNQKNMSDLNTIIYGHAIISKNIMFGSLYNVLNENWLSNSDNYIIQYLTKDCIYKYQVFSTYTIPKENYYLTINFQNINDFYQTLLLRSIHDYHVSLNSTDQILTLSTCYKNNSRLVLHAKLLNKLVR